MLERLLQSIMFRWRYIFMRPLDNLDKTQEVNKAGDGVFVILHLYKQGVPLCALVNEYMNRLAPRFPTTKFIRAISTTCIPNYPDKNLPTIFVYHEGALKSQIIGPEQMRGMNLTEKEFEFMLGKSGAIETDIKEDPKPKVFHHTVKPANPQISFAGERLHDELARVRERQ